MRANDHPRQAERLAALRYFNILDTPREARYDSIVELVAELCEAPVAVINLIDENRQWFKAEVGLGVRETPLETSLCSHVILQPGLTIINDTLADPRMCDNPLCLGASSLRFYAGALLQTDSGLPLGTLCVLDYKPRDLTATQKRTLTVLAQQVMTQIQLRREVQMSADLLQEVDHRVKNSLSLVNALLGLQSRQSSDPALKEALQTAQGRIASVAYLHDLLHRSTSALHVDVAELAQGIVGSLRAQSRPDIEIRSNLPGIQVSPRDGINIGIILNELATNALRHGFNEGRSGVIEIVGQTSDGRLWLSVVDNGVGLPPHFDLSSGTGVGMKLATSLTKLFATELRASRSPGGGASFRFDVPL